MKQYIITSHDKMNEIYTARQIRIVDALEQNDLMYLKENVHSNEQMIICLKHALSINANIEIIDYLIDHSEIDISGKEFISFLNGVYADNNIYILEHLKERYDIFNCCGKKKLLMDGSQHDINLNMFKLLINNSGKKWHTSTYYADQLVKSICIFNTHLDVIKFLDNFLINCEANVCVVDRTNTICRHNKNPDNIIYVFEIFRNGSQKYDPQLRILTALSSICRNQDLNVVKYLVNYYIDDFKQYMKTIECVDLLYLIPIIDDCDLLNMIISHVVDISYYTDISRAWFVTKINPLKLTNENISLLKLKDPFDMNFKEFIQIVDEDKTLLHCITKLPDKKKLNNYHKSNHVHDYTKRDFLFKHHGIGFYGDREVVYNEIVCLKEMQDMCDFSEEFSLGDGFVVPIPKYIINMYIQTIYEGEIDIFAIDQKDFIVFLKFIDQYPLKCMNINDIESDIVRYCAKYNVIDSMLSEIASRYQLKELYIYLHNKKYVTMHQKLF
jgi:hypothetical protein